MKSSQNYLVVLLLVPGSLATMWGNSDSSYHRGPAEYDPDPSAFNPKELLDPKTQKPEMWAKAISELQELKKKPSCSRLAASMLMNDCQLLEGVDGSKGGQLPVGVEGRLEDYINGYAASLAICDIEAAQGPVPEACEPFRETALLKHTELRGGENLHVSKDQIDQCMNGLISVPTSWTSWTSSRDRATLFCRASRIDIEKDQLIVLHQTVAEILRRMLSDSQDELQKRRQELAEHDQVVKSYFHDIIAQLGDVRKGVSEALSDLAGLVKNAKETIQDTSKDVQDVQKVLTTVRKTLLDTNAEHAAVQEVAVSATIELALQSRDAHTEVNALRGLLMEVKLNAVSMNAALASLMERQNVLDAQSYQTYIIMMNLTEALQDANTLSDDHLINLVRLKEVTSELHDSVELVSRSALGWSKSLFDFTGLFGISWPLLILSPPMTLFFGSYGMAPSLVRNFGLFFAGFPVAAAVTSVLNLPSESPLNIPKYTRSGLSHFSQAGAPRSSIKTAPVVLSSLYQSEPSAGISEPLPVED